MADGPDRWKAGIGSVFGSKGPKRRRSRSAPSEPAGETRKRPSITREPHIIYAIGDVHGELRRLRELEALIVEDAKRFPGVRLIVMLGDYVDRGPDAAGVLEHLVAAPPEGFYRVCLLGNHDLAFLDVLEGRVPLDAMLPFGAATTFRSYGCDLSEYDGGMRLNRNRMLRELVRHVPTQHRELLRLLPVSFETPGYFFAHAGVRPGVPLASQRDADLLGIREPFLGHPDRLSKVVVHGHTPAPQPFWDGRRIGVDTGACFGGALTAVRITRREIAFLSVG